MVPWTMCKQLQDTHIIWRRVHFNYLPWNGFLCYFSSDGIRWMREWLPMRRISHSENVRFVFVRPRCPLRLLRAEIAWVTFRRSYGSPKKCFSKISDDVSMSASYVLCILDRGGAIYVRRPHTQTHNHFFSIPLFFIIHIVVCVRAIFYSEFLIIHFVVVFFAFIFHFSIFSLPQFHSGQMECHLTGSWLFVILACALSSVCVWYIRSDANVFR